MPAGFYTVRRGEPHGRSSRTLAGMRCACVFLVGAPWGGARQQQTTGVWAAGSGMVNTVQQAQHSAP